MANIGKEKAGELGPRIGRQSAEAAAEAIKQNVLGNDKSA
jgi:hypothetical protein